MKPQAYRQIGNAIPPVLMWHVANALAENLNTMSKSIQVNELQNSSNPTHIFLKSQHFADKLNSG